MVSTNYIQNLPGKKNLILDLNKTLFEIVYNVFNSAVLKWVTSQPFKLFMQTDDNIISF